MTKAEKCKQWRIDNPEYKEKKNEERKKRYWEEPEYRKAELRKSALRLYRWTPEQYDAKLLEQDGHCALCENTAGKKSLHVDHDHECCGKEKKFTCGKCNRGILCQVCNTRLGYLEQTLREALVFPVLGKSFSWTARALRYIAQYEAKKETQK